MAQFSLPSTPKIKYVKQGKDKRSYCVIPIRAINDKRLSKSDLINLMLLASYSATNGYSFVALSTMAKYRGVSPQAISKGLKRLESKGYIKHVRKGFTNLRGALRRIIFDDTLTDVDVISISNNNEVTDYYERDYMSKRNKLSNKSKPEAVDNSVLTYEQALLVIQDSLKSEQDILRLEKLVQQGISRDALLEAFQ